VKYLIWLMRGFHGHPNHPPLTDATIGAYAAGSLMAVIGWFGFYEEKLAWGAFLSIGAGLIFAIPTMITGLFDFVRIPRGTGMRRVANAHWVSMTLSTAIYLLAGGALQRGFDEGEITTLALLFVGVAFIFLFAGGYIGGTIVFQYGMRVVNEPVDKPALKALTPKWPPD
jgi:uncharacterized membrane protein